MDYGQIDGADVRSARLAAGLTIEQAATATHCAMRTWQDWERGVASPDLARYRLFCHLTGLERIPFGTIQPEGISAGAEAAELAGKIDEMLRPKAIKRSR